MLPLKFQEPKGLRSSPQEELAEIRYWQSKSPAARMRELERLRQEKYGYGNGKPLPKFQRVMRVIKMRDT